MIFVLHFSLCFQFLIQFHIRFEILARNLSSPLHFSIAILFTIRIDFVFVFFPQFLGFKFCFVFQFELVTILFHYLILDLDTITNLSYFCNQKVLKNRRFCSEFGAQIDDLCFAIFCFRFVCVVLVQHTLKILVALDFIFIRCFDFYLRFLWSASQNLL